MRTLDLARRLPAYWICHRWGWPQAMPMNLTFSLTYRCNSRCATCNVWQHEVEEMSTEEWGRIFRSLGQAPYWVTFSGGEPLLRPDAGEIIDLACQYCRPAIVNIPTNGMLPERIVGVVKDLVVAHPAVSFVANLSLDGWGDDHDAIRGIPGNFERSLETFRRLRALRASNLTLGIHTVVSRFNAQAVPALYTRIQDQLAPDSYITEIAEERVELGTQGLGIAPTPEAYKQAIEQLIALQSVHSLSRLGRVTRAFRTRYYRLVERWMRERRQIITCYAGWASAQIAPDGDLWLCCVQASPIGNLREVGFDFDMLWRSERADQMRQEVRAGRCDCPLANAAYTNLLLHPRSLLGVGLEWAKGSSRG